MEAIRGQRSYCELNTIQSMLIIYCSSNAIHTRYIEYTNLSLITYNTCLSGITLSFQMRDDPNTFFMILPDILHAVEARASATIVRLLKFVARK